VVFPAPGGPMIPKIKRLFRARQAVKRSQAWAKESVVGSDI